MDEGQVNKLHPINSACYCRWIGVLGPGRSRRGGLHWPRISERSDGRIVKNKELFIALDRRRGIHDLVKQIKQMEGMKV